MRGAMPQSPDLVPLPAAASGVWTLEPARPRTLWEAVRRGLRNRCPRCGEARLMPRFLKPAPHCHACGLDLTPQRADDFPAYIAMIITGHLLAPVTIGLVLAGWSPVQMAALVLPGATALMLGLLQPAKGAVIAVQWWNGMHGFRRD